MRLNKKNLEKKLKEHNKKPKMSKKDERKVKKKMRRLRRLQRKHYQNIMSPMLLQLENDIEMKRIIKEVEEGS